MAKKDPRIDKIIQESPSFAQPILKHLRKLIHKHCPKTEETLKWGMPHFMYEGKILCGMGSFKEHCAFGFWHTPASVKTDDGKAKSAMWQFGRIASIEDLPTDAKMASFIKQSMKLIERGDETPKKNLKHKKPPVKPPADFTRAVRANKKALATYEAFSESCKREYVDWVTEAKTEETRERRLETAVEWMSQGKKRNWKYQ